MSECVQVCVCVMWSDCSPSETHSKPITNSILSSRNVSKQYHRHHINRMKMPIPIAISEPFEANKRYNFQISEINLPFTRGECAATATATVAGSYGKIPPKPKPHPLKFIIVTIEFYELPASNMKINHIT